MARCIPFALGVPHLEAPPNWWDSTQPASGIHKLDTRLQDPRWRGSYSQGFGIGTKEEATFRALYGLEPNGNKSLYLSWHVKFDPGVDIANDTLYVGMVPSAGEPLLIRIVISNDASDKTAAAAGSIRAGRRDAGSGNMKSINGGNANPALGDEPDWINATTRVWRSTADQMWAVQMKVPLNPLAATIADDTGIHLGAAFNLWYAYDVFTPTRADLSSTGIVGGVLRMLWPESTTIGANASGQVFPGPGNWESFTFGAAGDPSCGPAGGVAIETYTDIGSTNPLGSNWIDYIAPITGQLPPAQPTNILFVTPKNDSGVSVAVDTIKARFQIANWGSVASATAPWTIIGQDISNSINIPNGAKAAQNNINLRWAVPPAMVTDFVNGTKNKHQCLFVELSGVGVVFSRSSLYNNMDFRKASLIRQTATIDLRGLAAFSPKPRDVYLALEKRNLPVTLPANYSEGQFLSATFARLAQQDGELAAQLKVVQQQLADENNDHGSFNALRALLDALRRHLASLKSSDESSSGRLSALMSALNSWFNSAKFEEAASRGLAACLTAFADWLTSAGVIDRAAKALALAAALSTWLGGLAEDPSSDVLPIVIRTFRNWLGGLSDDSGAVARLGAFLENVQDWLGSERTPESLLKLLDAFNAWLSSVSDSEGDNTQNVLVWFASSVSEWLAGGQNRMSTLVGALRAAGVTADGFDQIFPTLRIHVYHDTGQTTLANDGKTYPVLGLQSSFGIHAYHEDSLAGWRTSIEGATQIAQDFYMLPVPNEGQATVTTVVQAVEKGETPIPEDRIAPPRQDNPGCLTMLLMLLRGKK